ncbi:unnamed protein product [Kuraishia capsulata CBS 1993]|uniref:RecF/RecN/SMC N-terminal domain-containing protein n=1 Tax=Kuraishia capsulata CBS 1993 TaxID=1382522 RepID=W6MHH7_9ASCO|nr:uncharacterized protein KUCA_T00001689001 [Kuraishia capsulata CBS 1993]CDK25719.1 unnamed protein product [Kuraishia capsulata CBS 1993]
MPEKRPASDDLIEDFLDSEPDDSLDEDEKGNQSQRGHNVLAQFTQDPQANKRRRLAEAISSSQVSTGSQSNNVRESTAGVIESIRMTNFMCHSNFEVTLGPQTNFIIGKNGSGKSAVLTCLSVCLGAKANETDRGSNLKAMIKNGKNTARLSVTFKNEGMESYLPEVYGNRIIVQRFLKRDGTSGYSMKSVANKTISTKKAELDAMLNHFGITITNPMTVLTQTEAKQFLASSTSEHKFKYFMAGTRLDIAVSDCTKTDQDLKDVRSMLSRNSLILEESAKNFKAARDMYARLQSTDQNRQKLRTLLGRMKWWKQLKMQEQLDHKLANKEKLQALMDQARRKADEAQNSMLALETELQTISDTKLEAESECNRLEAVLSSTKDTAKATQKQSGVLEARLKACTDAIKETNENLQTLEKRIKMEEERLENSDTSTTDGLLVQKSGLERQLTSLDQEKAQLASRKKAEIALHKARLSEITETIAEKDKYIKDLRKELSQNFGRQRDKYWAYGPGLRHLLDEIQRTKTFHSTPFGPLGLSVSMKPGKEGWSQIVENVLNRQMSSFLVQDFHDQKILSGLFRKHKYFGDILVRQLETFDYRNSLPSSDLTSIMDVLNFQDENVKCVFIDEAKINFTCLMTDRSQAEEALIKRPRNVKAFLVPYDRGSATRLMLGDNSNILADPIKFAPARSSKLGSSDPEEALKQEVARQQQEMNELIAEKTTLIASSNTEKAGIEKSLKQITHKITETTDELNDLIALIEDESTDSGKLKGLTEDRDDYISRNIAHNETLTALKAERENNGNRLMGIEARYRAEKEALKAQQQRVSDLKKLMEERHDKLAEFEGESNHYTISYKQKSEKMEILENTIMALEENCGDLHRAAAQVCTLEESGANTETQTEDSIRQEYVATKEAVDSIEKSLGMTREQVISDVKAKREKYLHAKQSLGEAQSMAEKLGESLRERKQNLKTTRKRLCMEVNEAFQQALSIRAFVGELEFDFENGKLSMMVSTKPGEKKRMVESLSGGEKSFTQIAFLLALWKPMQSRIRGLDEFDVFMDQINRRLSLKMILDKVSKNPYCQTLFITPLDVGDVPGVDSPTVHIHQIADPERNVA